MKVAPFTAHQMPRYRTQNPHCGAIDALGGRFGCRGRATAPAGRVATPAARSADLNGRA